MEKNANEPYQNKFREWLDTIPTGQFNAIRFRVINECKITDQIFKHWKCGNSKVPVLAWPIINEIAGIEVFKIEKK